MDRPWRRKTAEEAANRDEAEKNCEAVGGREITLAGKEAEN